MGKKQPRDEEMHTTHPPQTDKDDAVLLDLLTRRDRSAFGFVYSKYANRLLSYGIGLGFDRDTVKDAIHDVFCKIYASSEFWDNIKSLKSYLFKSLKNRLLNMAKPESNLIDLEPEGLEFSVKVTVLDQLIKDEDRYYIQLEVEKYLNSLTGRQREAVYLRFIQELEYEEIAGLLEMTPHGVRKLVSRAIIRMRSQHVSIYFLLLSSGYFRL
jgi:RNA polymerase sigma factor (sigma-70 family)